MLLTTIDSMTLIRNRIYKLFIVMSILCSCVFPSYTMNPGLPDTTKISSDTSTSPTIELSGERLQEEDNLFVLIERSIEHNDLISLRSNFKIILDYLKNRTDHEDYDWLSVHITHSILEFPCLALQEALLASEKNYNPEIFDYLFNSITSLNCPEYLNNRIIHNALNKQKSRLLSLAIITHNSSAVTDIVNYFDAEELLCTAVTCGYSDSVSVLLQIKPELVIQESTDERAEQLQRFIRSTVPIDRSIVHAYEHTPRNNFAKNSSEARQCIETAYFSKASRTGGLEVAAQAYRTVTAMTRNQETEKTVKTASRLSITELLRAREQGNTRLRPASYLL